MCLRDGHIQIGHSQTSKFNRARHWCGHFSIGICAVWLWALFSVWLCLLLMDLGTARSQGPAASPGQQEEGNHLVLGGKIGSSNINLFININRSSVRDTKLCPAPSRPAPTPRLPERAVA